MLNRQPLFLCLSPDEKGNERKREWKIQQQAAQIEFMLFVGVYMYNDFISTIHRLNNNRNVRRK